MVAELTKGELKAKGELKVQVQLALWQKVRGADPTRLAPDHDALDQVFQASYTPVVTVVRCASIAHELREQISRQTPETGTRVRCLLKHARLCRDSL